MYIGCVYRVYIGCIARVYMGCVRGVLGVHIWCMVYGVYTRTTGVYKCMTHGNAGV